MNVVNYIKTRPHATPPAKGTAGAAAIDLASAEHGMVPIGQTRVFKMGIHFAIPKGHVGLVCSRSGLAAKRGIFVLNAPGVIDEDYRGEMMVILANYGEDDFHVNIGDRIGQLMIVKLPELEYQEVATLDETERGANGFGSTGV